MTARRGATGLSGVLVIDKPGGMTSHDVVARLRRSTGERRIGHAGTLDPLATGVLLVLVGSATRLERYLSGHDKSYRARIVFGAETDTLDSDGEVVSVSEVPAPVLDLQSARELLAGFRGRQSQVPPSYSAIKRDGVPAHRLARAGVEVVMEPREIDVYEAALQGIEPEAAAWDVVFSVSKGTYVRSLARDIGRAAGSAAHLTALRRTSVGTLLIEQAVSLDDACAAAEKGALPGLFVDPVPALGFPVVQGDAGTVRSGRPLPMDSDDGLAPGQRLSVIVDGRLGAIYVRSGSGALPESVFVPEVAR